MIKCAPIRLYRSAFFSKIKKSEGGSVMFYRKEPLFLGLTRIWDVANTAMYLLEGEKRAVLVDTGVGVGDLKTFIESLTDKPVTVLITHGHVDHAMGTAGFEDVRISPLDAEVYAEHCSFEGRKGYVMGSAMQGGDPAQVAGISDGDFLLPRAFSDFAPLTPGDCIDLGGVTVEVLRGVGHTPGSLTMLIPELRVLILGDACNQFTFLFDRHAASVTEYREMLMALKEETDGRYDCVLVSHGTGEGAPEMVDNVIAVCEDILGGTADNLPFQSPFGTCLIAKAMDFAKFCRMDGVHY